MNPTGVLGLNLQLLDFELAVFLGGPFSTQGQKSALQRIRELVNVRGIAEFLETMQEGELDSSGVFTLEWSKALEKLARYQSDAAGFWVVKFLQAAVACGASSLNIQQAAQHTLVSFAPQLPAEEIVDALQRLDPPAHPGLAHLQIGVQAVSFVPETTHELRLTVAGEVQSFPVRQACLVGRLEHNGRAFPRLDFVRHWTRPPGWLWNRGPARRYTEENLFLQEVGRFAPITIRVDGRLLNDPLANKPPGLRLGVPVTALGRRPWPAVPYTMLERIVLTEGFARERMALLNHAVRRARQLRLDNHVQRGNGTQAYCQEWVSEHGQLNPANFNSVLVNLRAPFGTFDSKIERADSETELWPDYNLKLPAMTVRGYLSIDLCPGDEGRLYLIKDGVALKPCSLGPRFRGCLALWSEPRIRTDLSQLQVLGDSVYLETVQKITEHYESAARNVLASEEPNPGFIRGFFRVDSRRAMEWARRFLA